MTFLKALQQGEKLLGDANLGKDAAKLLILHFTKMSPADLYANLNGEIDFDYDIYEHALQSYISGVPLQRIRGYEFFHGRRFELTEGTFIPRPETELLCELAIERIQDLGIANPTVADLGSGSGVLAITVALAMPTAKVLATELSEEAVVVAKKNAARLGAKVSFRIGSFGLPLIKDGVALDALVCNPPYIRNEEPLEARVLDHDPHLALFGGVDGLNCYREIFAQMADLFKGKRKWLACFEIGSDQKEALAEMVKSVVPLAKAEFVKDYAGMWRIMLLKHE